MTARAPFRNMTLAALLVALMVLVVGAAAGGADPGGHAQRDHGHGAWFKRACDAAPDGSAACQAQVVSDASGDPLAGSNPPASALTPAEFSSGYNLASAQQAGPTSTVAIVDAYDDPNAESDLAAFDSKFGLPACSTANGCFRKVNETGGTKYPAKNSGWDLEISLDLQTVHSICPTCKILLVEASSAYDSDLGAAENEAASLGAVAISNSWGGGEVGGEASLDSQYFNHPGIAITASSGDGGYGVEWPAASPDVTAVGGTTLNLDSNGNYLSESAWVDAGSGCSSQETKPTWQTDGGVGGCPNRTVADVSADADPNTGAAVYDSVAYQGSSGWFQVGGTSLSSPLIASIYALAGANGKNVTGASIPYADPNQGSDLHDVMTGSNGSCSPSYLCTARVGFDGPTGLGTPNGVCAFSATSCAPPGPDFSLSVSAQNGGVIAGTGGSVSYTVSTAVVSGTGMSVTLSASGLPANVTQSFNPGSPTAGGGSSLTLSVPASIAANTYTFQINGSYAGGPTHPINASLVVQSPRRPTSRSLPRRRPRRSAAQPRRPTP